MATLPGGWIQRVAKAGSKVLPAPAGLSGPALVAAFLGVIYLFEKRRLALWLVNGGYCVVALTVMGAILGAL